VITRWNRSICLASWETGSFWDFASRETSRRTNREIWQVVINQGVLASGPSAHAKNVRDLTLMICANLFLNHAMKHSFLFAILLERVQRSRITKQSSQWASIQHLSNFELIFWYYLYC
jgi:hypothetical protein